MRRDPQRTAEPMSPDRVHMYIAVVDLKVDPIAMLGRAWFEPLWGIDPHGGGDVFVPIKGKCLNQTKSTFAKEGIDAERGARLE